jgi:hypothetical protein
MQISEEMIQIAENIRTLHNSLASDIVENSLSAKTVLLDPFSVLTPSLPSFACVLVIAVVDRASVFRFWCVGLNLSVGSDVFQRFPCLMSSELLYSITDSKSCITSEDSLS